MKNNLLYVCYSVPLKDFLTNKGIKYEIVGLNPKTLNMFWVYIKNQKLIDALVEWSNKV